MKKRSCWLKGVLAGVCILMFYVSVLVPSAFSARSYKIGIVTSLSGPGYAYGKRAVIGVQYVVDQINRAGGINGYPVKLIVYDTGTKAAQAAMLTERAVSADKVLAILGPNASSDTAAAFATAKRLKTPDIAMGGTLRGICARNAPWCFSTMMSDDFSMEPMVTVIKEHHVKNMVVMVDAKYNYAVSQGNWGYKIAKRMGIKVLNERGKLDVETGWADFTPRVTQLKALSPQLICAILFPKDLAHFAVALNAAGISAKTTPCYASLMLQPDFVIAAGAAANGWYGSADFLLGGRGDPVQVAWEKKMMAFAKTKTDDPGIITPQTNTACGYDAAAFLCEAIRKTGITPSTPIKEARSEIMHRLPKIRMKTYSSKVFYFGKGGRYEKNRLVKPMFLLQVVNGKIVGRESTK